MRPDPDDLITHANFGLYRLDVFRSGSGQSLPSPTGLLYGPYNTATRYRAGM